MNTFNEDTRLTKQEFKEVMSKLKSIKIRLTELHVTIKFTEDYISSFISETDKISKNDD